VIPESGASGYRYRRESWIECVRQCANVIDQSTGPIRIVSKAIFFLVLNSEFLYLVITWKAECRYFARYNFGQRNNLGRRGVASILCLDLFTVKNIKADRNILL